MKKILKVLAMVMALMLVVTCFAACGKDKEEGENDETAKTTSTTAVTTTQPSTATTTLPSADVPSVAGNTYVFKSYEGPEAEMMAEFLADMEYAFASDGTGTARMMDEEVSFNYTQTGDTLTLSDNGNEEYGEDEIFKVVGNTIVSTVEEQAYDENFEPIEGEYVTSTLTLVKK